jgi:hypothetical protein
MEILTPWVFLSCSGKVKETNQPTSLLTIDQPRFILRVEGGSRHVAQARIGNRGLLRDGSSVVLSGTRCRSKCLLN